MSRLLQRTIAITTEHELEALSTGRRAAELIQQYWPEIYAEHLRDLTVTPATLCATVLLFLGLADRDLLDMQPWWEIPVDSLDPVGTFQQQIAKPPPLDALTLIHESNANVWEPAPMTYGLDLEWLYHESPDDSFALIAAIWRVWGRNPIHIFFFGYMHDAEAATLVQNPDLQAAIGALEPIPMLDIPDVRDAFWEALDFDLGVHDAHRITLSDVIGYALGMVDNEYAAISVSDLNENYAGNFGIDWSDPEHVHYVKSMQDEGSAIAVAFWQFANLVHDQPSLIPLLGEALRAAAADAMTLHPHPEIEALRAQLRAIQDANREEPLA